jgi:hypothetical protein
MVNQGMRHLVAVLVIGLLLGAGACLFDVGDQAGEDLCLVFVAVTCLPTLGIPLPLLGGIPALPTPVYSLVRPDFPAPPPRA